MMVKSNLDPRILKSVQNIEKKVIEVENVLRDLSMKLCHIIRDKKDPYDIYQDMINGKNYFETP